MKIPTAFFALILAASAQASSWTWGITTGDMPDIPGDNPLIHTLAAVPPPIINNPGDSIPPGSAVDSLTPLFTWTQITGATGYRLYIFDQSTGNLVFPVGVPPLLTGSSYRLPAGFLQYGKAYQWAMSSFDGSSDSGLSIFRYFQAPPFPPPAPVAKAATAIGISRFDANWNLSVGATGYRIDVSTSSNFSSFINGGEDVDVGNTTGATVSGLNSGTTYYYRVRAYNGGSTSGNSATISATTLPNSLPAPTATAATFVTVGSFFANWIPASGATGYRLDISRSSTFATFIPGWQDADVGNINTAFIDGLTVNTTYYYRLRSYNNVGTSSNSLTIAVTTGSATVAVPPVKPATGVTVTGFTANWGTAAGATGYRLDVSLSSSFNSYLPGFQNLNVGTATNKTLTGLTANTTYFYRVRGYNSTTNSGNSGTIPVTTLSGSLGAPTASTGLVFSATLFIANWNALSGATGYRLDVSTNSTFSNFLPGFDNADQNNNVSAIVSGLTGGTTYYYRVRAYNLTGTGPVSGTVAVTTLPYPPAAPVAIAAVNVTASGFAAKWNAAATATSYRLDISTNSVFDSFVSGYQDANVGNFTSKVVSGLTPGTTFYYRVRAANAGGTSGNSGTIAVTTIPPAPVADPATSITNTSFVANWEAAPGATGYRLDVSISTNFSSYVSGFQNLNVTNATSRLVTGLTAVKAYFYRVRAYNPSGTSSNSSIITLTTLPNPPAAPAALAATGVTSNSFTANWKSVAGATGYRLDISTTNNFTTFVPGYQNLDVLNVTNQMVVGLIPATNYFYRVRAYNVVGAGVSSATIAVTTLPIAPGAPTALAATGISTNRFTANWTTVPGATGYRLDISTNGAFSNFITGYQNFDAGNGTNRNVTGLIAGISYFYRVRAYNTGGTSDNSATITVATPPKPPTVPVASAATSVTNNSFTANWGVATGATSYRLDVSTSSTFANYLPGYQDLDVGNVNSRSVTGLNGSTTYYYRVRGFGLGGAGGNSARITVVTLPNPPAAPVTKPATSVTATSFTANWNSTSGATSYRLDISTNSLFTSFIPGYQNLTLGNVAARAVSGLTAGTTYFYRVRGVNTGGTSDNSGTITAVTIPPAPIALAASGITSTGFTANWNSTSGASGYRLDVATNSTFTAYVSGWQNLDVSNVLSSNVGGLITNKFYYYRVRAYNANGTSGNSATNSAKTLPAAPPTPPSLATSYQGGNLVISWPTNDPAYKLFYATNVSATTWISNTAVPSIVGGQYTVTNGTTGGAQFYQLKK